ncbi:hypothetical protein L1887_32743 [Cichorium endivia]|nr:hypothetical protein L1887_32743 [Cichorium endivia]
MLLALLMLINDSDAATRSGVEVHPISNFKYEEPQYISLKLRQSTSVYSGVLGSVQITTASSSTSALLRPSPNSACIIFDLCSLESSSHSTSLSPVKGMFNTDELMLWNFQFKARHPHHEKIAITEQIPKNGS